MKILDASTRVPVKLWIEGVPVQEEALDQLRQVASLPFIHKHVAVMPDVHAGAGSTVGCVIPTEGAVCPAAVGVDIGCGMIAACLDIRSEDMEGLESSIRSRIEALVPHGRTDNGGPEDVGSWKSTPDFVKSVWDYAFDSAYEEICERDPKVRARRTDTHLGTLGTGNHFIEISTDENGVAWIVLHSGSRGPGNRIGTYFTQVAKRLCEKWFVDLPHSDLAYLPTHTEEFKRYQIAVQWAQRFALMNRQMMMEQVREALCDVLRKNIEIIEQVNCHHNYISWENHYGKNVIVTRKGALRVRQGELGFIPGSMGARSYVVRGLGNRESFFSCSHGAGRVMSRTEAKRRFTVEDHIQATRGVECKKDESVIDETPMAYKNIDAVMRAQADIVEPVHVLKQIICVKG